MLDEQSGNLGKSSGGKSGNSKAYSGGFKDGFYNDLKPGFGDSGGASRFFYCAKASSAERNKGCESLPLRTKGASDGTSIDNTLKGPTNSLRPDKATISQNNHPTVKPIKLIEYLLKLITPPKNALVLDPFAGSGSTLVAAKNLGIACEGIEISEEYCQIAKSRIN